MEYTKEQIEDFADEMVDKLMSEPKLEPTTGLNIEVAYQLSGQMEEDSRAIRQTNPYSRLFRATFEDDEPLIKGLRRQK